MRHDLLPPRPLHTWVILAVILLLFSVFMAVTHYLNTRPAFIKKIQAEHICTLAENTPPPRPFPGAPLVVPPARPTTLPLPVIPRPTPPVPPTPSTPPAMQFG